MNGGGGGVLTSKSSERVPASPGGCSNQVDGERGGEVTATAADGARSVGMAMVSSVISRGRESSREVSGEETDPAPTTAPTVLTVPRGVSTASEVETSVDGRFVSRPSPTGVVGSSATVAPSSSAISSPKIQFCCKMSDLTMLAACPRFDIDRPNEAGPGGGFKRVLRRQKVSEGEQEEATERTVRR